MKGIISDHGIEGIENISNVERPRAIAAFVFLVELLFGSWLSISILAPPLVGGQAGEAARFISIGGPMLWPGPVFAAAEESLPPDAGVVAPEAASADKQESDSQFGEEGGVEGGTAVDDVRIVSISPGISQGLFTGDAINFVVGIEYNLTSAATGTVALLIEECLCAPGPPLNPAVRFRETESTAVKSGRRTVTLAHKIRVPAVRQNTRLEVHAVLESDGPARKQSDDMKPYQITDSGKPPSGSESSVRITSIEPDGKSALQSGVMMDFAVAISYNLISEVGMLQFSIEESGSKSVLHFEPARINKGLRSLTFYHRMRLPDIPSGGLTVTARLEQFELRDVNDDGVTRTTLVPVPAGMDSRSFRVEGRR